MWDGNNIPCDYGCSPEHLDAMKNEAKRLYPNKPYCARHNGYGDLVVSDQDEKLFSQPGVNPCFVRCLEVIGDEAADHTYLKPCDQQAYSSFIVIVYSLQEIRAIYWSAPGTG